MTCTLCIILCKNRTKSPFLKKTEQKKRRISIKKRGGATVLNNSSTYILYIYYMRGIPNSAHSLRMDSGQMLAWISPMWALRR